LLAPRIPPEQRLPTTLLPLQAPETINGRLAMLGFVAAAAAEVSTGQGVLAQASQEPVGE
jgi:hypothetical protein